jgi:glycerol-3-phosphate dehydrogenase
VEPALGARLVEGRPDIAAEAVHAVRAEMALTLEDVLGRRMHLLHELGDGGLGVAGRVARRIAAEPGIGWDEAETARQLASYRTEVERTRGAMPAA